MSVISIGKLFAEVTLARVVEREALTIRDATDSSPSSKHTLTQALAAFRSLGFNCIYYSGTSFTIEAEPSVFETAFDINIKFDTAEPSAVTTTDSKLLEELPKNRLPANSQANVLGISGLKFSR